MDHDSNAIALLILEHGASWPEWAADLRLRSPNMTVESQQPLEAVDEFRARVLKRLDRLEGQGFAITHAAYVCAVDEGPLDSATRDTVSLEDLAAPLLQADARRDITSQILQLMELAPSDDSELILAGGQWEEDGAELASRVSLIQLCGDLSQAHPGRVVSVRFETAANEELLQASEEFSQETVTESGVYRVSNGKSSNHPVESSTSERPAQFGS